MTTLDDIKEKLEAIRNAPNESNNQKNHESISKVERRGGKRKGAGRKPKKSILIGGIIDQLTEVSTIHDLELTLTDKNTGKEITVTKPKVLVLIQGSIKR